MRRSAPARALVTHMLKQPETPVYGYELIRALGYGSGSIYPILGRLVDAGWVLAETGALGPEDRRQRRMYRFAPDGAAAARAWLDGPRSTTRKAA